MKLGTLMILLTILITENSLAQNAAALDKGQIAPFKGVLITESQLQEYDKAVRSNVALKELGDLYDLRVEQYKKDLSEAKSELNKAHLKGYLGTTGGFILGVLITGFAAKAAIKATQ